MIFSGTAKILIRLSDVQADLSLCRVDMPSCIFRGAPAHLL